MAATGFQPDTRHRPQDHPDVAFGRIGVLLVNLGTPDEATAKSVRKYLKEFLSDKRVIEDESVAWRIAFRIVLALRPRRKAKDYAKIWNKEKNESPLKTITRSQAEKLAAPLTEIHPNIVVDWAMRYGNPSIPSRIDALARAGCDRILFFPLYPQYSAATTATACDIAFRRLLNMRWQPTLRVVPPYYDNDVYIEALMTTLREHLALLDFTPDVIVNSFHGLPREYFLKGDPYYCHCAKTTRLMRERLNMTEDRFIMTFQSRFGRAEWLQPYTAATMKELARKGVRDVVVITPGFSADCLETLEEIAMENAHIFKKAGGRNFSMVPCLNDSEDGMRVIRTIVRRELEGWV
ncbi:MAG: ferrochelatase [Pseudorhodoplanes sp.]|nr:ferrochelatase [Pseudorhodoplanes sp.]